LNRYECQVTSPAVNLAANDWPEPEEIKATLPPVPPFDQRLLPKVFRDWVADIAERMQCPVEFLAVGAMVAAGAVVGRTSDIIHYLSGRHRKNPHPSHVANQLIKMGFKRQRIRDRRYWLPPSPG
jgi:hypothetical protein